MGNHAGLPLRNERPWARRWRDESERKNQQPATRKRNKVLRQDLKEKIAQMIMVGFKEAEVGESTPVVRAIRDFSLGGVILYNIDLKCFLEAQKKKPDLSRYDGAR